MLFYNQRKLSYEEAVDSCAKYGAHLVEVFTEDGVKYSGRVSVTSLKSDLIGRISPRTGTRIAQ